MMWNIFVLGAKETPETGTMQTGGLLPFFFITTRATQTTVSLLRILPESFNGDAIPEAEELQCGLNVISLSQRSSKYASYVFPAFDFVLS